MGGSVGRSLDPTNPTDFLGGGTLGKIGSIATGGLLVKPISQGFTKLTGIGSSSNNDSSVPGPFKLNQEQFDADRAAIAAEGAKQYGAANDLGQSQYNQLLQGIGDVGTANTQRAKDLFEQTLPNIAENAQAAHLFDSTGYGQEVARQQANLASDVANREAQLKLGALGQLQGAQQGALGIQNNYGQAGLGRGLSLEDFINQANVAKTIGAQLAPQMPSGKGTAVGGLGAGAAAGAPFGPWGAAIGGGLGYLGGGGLNSSSGGRGK
jgi:hypothetical protein